jgi:hypothetical protein
LFFASNPDVFHLELFLQLTFQSMPIVSLRVDTFFIACRVKRRQLCLLRK